jgi:hypothetical protein
MTVDPSEIPDSEPNALAEASDLLVDVPLELSECEVEP